MDAFALLYAIVGLALGPLLAAIVRSLPLDRPILSHRCPQCDADAGVGHLLGRSCPRCGLADRTRTGLITLASAALFGFLWLRFGLTPAVLLQSVYFSIFLVLFVIDLEHRWLPDRIVLPAAAFAAIAGSISQGPMTTLVGGAVGFGLLAVLFGGGVLVSRRLQLQAEAIGAGDVKLAGLIGLATGWPDVLTGLMIGFFLGGIVALLLVGLRIVRLGSYIPYAPFLLSGAAIVLVDGPRLVAPFLGG